MPLVAALLSWVVLREVPRASSIVASVLAAIGVILTIVAGTGEGRLAGDIVAMFMTLATVSALIVQRSSHQSVEPVASAAAAGFLCTLCSAPFASAFDVTAGDLQLLILFGMVNTGFGFILFFIGARYVPATVSGLIGALDAPLAPFWVWLVIGETPRGTTLLGGAIVIGAVMGHIAWSMRSDPGVPRLK
jgi:drug/metabolite transporter (DMT)-like permease